MNKHVVNLMRGALRLELRLGKKSHTIRNKGLFELKINPADGKEARKGFPLLVIGCVFDKQAETS